MTTRIRMKIKLNKIQGFENIKLNQITKDFQQKDNF